MNEVMKVSENGEKLYSQPIYGENVCIENIFSILNVEPQLFENRPSLNQGETCQILLVYPTKKEEKIIPLRNWAQSQISAHFNALNIEVDFAEESFDVPDTGVGEQPYCGDPKGLLSKTPEEIMKLHDDPKRDPKGFRGAYNRLKYCQDELLPLEKSYHGVFILSMESDLSEGEICSDAPNFIAFECFTGLTIAGRGRGPAAQKDFLAIAQESGFKDEVKLCGNRTYGDVLHEKFGIKSSDWHGYVCNLTRAQLFKELLNTLEMDLSKFIQLTYSSPLPSMRR